MTKFSPRISHSFDVEIATALGLAEAAVFNNIHYWVHQNSVNEDEDRHYRDGMWWTYNTAEKISEHMPYLSQKQVKLALQNLVASGYLIKGNYNKNSFDHTAWYTVSDFKKVLTMGPNGPIEGPKRAHPKAEMGPSIDTYVNPLENPIRKREALAPDTSISKKEKKQKKPTNPEKIPFRENVLLTQEEHDKLLAEVGAEQFDWMLDELNCKKASNGYVYDCDAATMWKNGWVRKAWNDHISKPQVSRPGSAPPAGNEELAKKAEKEWVSTLNPPHAKIEITYDSIRIIPQYGMHSQEKFLKFSEDAFSQKIENFMRNAGFVKRKA